MQCSYNSTECQISIVIPVQVMTTSFEINAVKDLRVSFVVVDDGSSEECYENLRNKFVSLDNVTLIRQIHKGAGAARNAGIKAAKGKYIYFLDADDNFVGAEILLKMADIAERENADIVGGSMKEIRQDGSVFSEWQGFDKKFVFEKEGWIDYKDYQYDYGFYRFLYRRDFLSENKLFFSNLKRFQDPPFFVRCMLKAEKFFAIKETTYIYNVHPTQYTLEKTRDLLKGIIYNLYLSRKNGLDELHFTTVIRLYRDFFDFVFPYRKKCLFLLFVIKLLLNKAVMEKFSDTSEYAIYKKNKFFSNGLL